MGRLALVVGVVGALQIATTFVSFAQFTAVANPGLPKLDFAAAAWGDYDNDGYLDVAIAGLVDSTSVPLCRIYHNNHDGTFTDINANLPGLSYCSLAWGDYDNDGRLDLLIAGTNSSNTQITYLYHNDGGGVFSRNTATAFDGMGHGCVSWGDYNNDGYLDFVVCGYNAGAPHIKLYRNNGNGTFSEETNASSLTPVNAYAKALWADFNNDGRLDLLIVGRSNGASTSDPKPVSKIFFNSGNGTFTEDTAAHLVGVWLCSAAVGDYNNDGYVDLALGGFYTPDSAGLPNRDTSLIYRNNGDSTFTAIPNPVGQTHSSSMAWADINGDGRLDLVVTGWTAGEGIYLNNGGGSFSKLSVALGWVAQGAAIWGDINNDGYPDLLMTGISHATSRDTTVVYLNSEPGTNSTYAVNSAPSAPTGLSANVAGNDVTLSWNRASDAQTPSASLSYNLRVGSTPGGIDVISPPSNPSTGFARVARLGDAYLNSSWTIKGLAKGTYHWSVQSLDNAFAASPFAAESTFTVVNPLPITLSSFSASLSGGNEVVVHWTTASEIDCYGFNIQKSLSATYGFADVPGSFTPGNGTTLVAHSYSFTDDSTKAGTWYYRLKQIDLSGAVHYFEPVSVVRTTSVQGPGTPLSFALDQNYPNPFNPTTVVSGQWPVPSEVRLAVYDILGRQVAVLAEGRYPAGKYSFSFNAAGLASGTYIYRLTAGAYSEVRKMTLLK